MSLLTIITQLSGWRPNCIQTGLKALSVNHLLSNKGGIAIIITKHVNLNIIIIIIITFTEFRNVHLKIKTKHFLTSGCKLFLK